MRVAVVVLIIIALQCCCPTHGQLTEWSVRCSAPAAELTKEATVTCLFPHNIRQRKTDFIVRHNQNIVADFMWANGKLECTMKPGYEFEEQDVDTTSVTLRIPHFLQIHTGQYFCQADGKKFEICLLLPLKPHLTPATIAMTAAESIQLEQNNLISETTSRPEESKQSGTSLIIIVSATGAAITLASVVVIAYIVYRYYILKKSVRKIDKIQMADTEARDSRHNFEGVVQSLRTPTQETNNGQHADVTTNDGYFVVLRQTNVEEDDQRRIISTNNPTALRDKEACENYNPASSIILVRVSGVTRGAYARRLEELFNPT